MCYSLLWACNSLKPHSTRIGQESLCSSFISEKIAHPCISPADNKYKNKIEIQMGYPLTTEL